MEPRAAPPPVSTFSIVARDPQTSDLGVAVASKFLAVGAVVPTCRAGVGAIATQSYANVSYGPRALAALEAGVPLAQIQAAFAATDPEHATRQYGMVAASGEAVTFTGDGCHPWAGGRAIDGVAIQGNLLAGPEVLEAMADAWRAHGGAMPERLAAALLAGDRAGGDRRGRQSAALVVVRERGGYGGLNDRYVDLRVDDHDDPVPELARLLGLQRLYFERPRPEDRLAVEGEVERRLVGVLTSAGRLDAPRPWDEACERELRALAGVENLEERMLEPGLVDRVALEHLERLHPPRG